MDNSAILVTAILLPIVITRLSLSFFVNWQAQKKLLITNFEGKKIATAGGAVLFLSLVFCYYFFSRMPNKLPLPYALLLFYLFGITLLGAIDDIWGEKECKGLKGHLMKLWKKEGISTGIYKAAGGLLLGFFVSSRINEGIMEWIMGGLFLALLTNFFNLLDTRPVRSAKVFFLISFVIVIFFRDFALVLLPVWGILIVYLPWELNKKIMLGDTGAYLLGGILGIFSLFALSGKTIVFLNLILLIIHLFCERFSLNRIIEEKFSHNLILRTGRKN